jgi:hypothetical protein
MNVRAGMRRSTFSVAGFWGLVIFALSAAFVSGAGFSLGDSANYAVLFEGSGNHSLQINSGPLNGSTITGDIGLGNLNGGNPQAQFNNPAVINGDVNFAALKNSGNGNVGNAIINGSVNYGITAVSNDLVLLNALSAKLGGESGTAVSINLSGTGGNQTINASAGMLDAGGNRVFNLTSMTFNNGNTLTINGDTAGDFVVINVSSANINNPHFAGAISLTGGLTPNEVLFNITGGNVMTLSGGSTLQTSANNAFQNCSYLDPDGTINVDSVNIVGHLFGGDSSDMQIVSGATVDSPVLTATPEPSATALAALMLLPFAARSLRRLRKRAR